MPGYITGDIILWRKQRIENYDCKHIAIFLQWEDALEDGTRRFSVMDADSNEGCNLTTYNLKNIHDVYTWVDDVPGEDNLPIFHDD